MDFPRTTSTASRCASAHVSNVERVCWVPDTNCSTAIRWTSTAGVGVYLYDADGNQYLDAYNNVASVGHSHPAVAEAVSTQLGIINTNTRLRPRPDSRLLRRSPVDIPIRAGPRDVHLHWLGSERPRDPNRARAHRQHGNHRHPQRVSRSNRDRRILLPVPGQVLSPGPPTFGSSRSRTVPAVAISATSPSS